MKKLVLFLALVVSMMGSATAGLLPPEIRFYDYATYMSVVGKKQMMDAEANIVLPAEMPAGDYVLESRWARSVRRRNRSDGLLDAVDGSVDGMIHAVGAYPFAVSGGVAMNFVVPLDQPGTHWSISFNLRSAGEVLWSKTIQTRANKRIKTTVPVVAIYRSSSNTVPPPRPVPMTLTPPSSFTGGIILRNLSGIPIGDYGSDPNFPRFGLSVSDPEIEGGAEQRYEIHTVINYRENLAVNFPHGKWQLTVYGPNNLVAVLPFSLGWVSPDEKILYFEIYPGDFQAQ